VNAAKMNLKERMFNFVLRRKGIESWGRGELVLMYWEHCSHSLHHN
jgi:hypothetical protein